MVGQVTVVRRCAAESCAWNDAGACRAREITITVNRRGGMSCWNYTDAEREEMSGHGGHGYEHESGNGPIQQIL